MQIRQNENLQCPPVFSNDWLQVHVVFQQHWTTSWKEVCVRTPKRHEETLSATNFRFMAKIHRKSVLCSDEMSLNRPWTFDRIFVRTFDERSLEQITKFAEFRLHYFCTILYIDDWSGFCGLKKVRCGNPSNLLWIAKYIGCGPINVVCVDLGKHCLYILIVFPSVLMPRGQLWAKLLFYWAVTLPIRALLGSSVTMSKFQPTAYKIPWWRSSECWDGFINQSWQTTCTFFLSQ